MDPEYITLLIPVLTKAAISGIRKVSDVLPKWAYPILAPIIGVVIERLGYAAGLETVGPLLSALAGAAGVAIHEGYKQIGK